MRQQIRAILLEAQPKMVAIESLHPISMMASARGTIAAPGKNVAAKRKLNESLAESAIGHVGKLLREEAAKLGIPTVSVPPHGTSQTCPRCGDRHPKNRESQAVFRCRNCGLYAHADWTAAVIIRNRAYVRHCEWQSGFTPEVLTAPTGWREQPSSSEPRQPRLGLELSVFKPEGTATSSDRNRVRGPRPASRIQAASQGAKSVTNSVSHGIHSRGYSAVLNLHLRWEQGQLAWYDPATGNPILTYEDQHGRADAEREARVRAEARVQELEAELRRLQNP